MVRHGIDVSQWQDVIDWEKVKAAGIEFAMIRATFGTDKMDKRFRSNIEECNRLGIPVGVYHFSYGKNSDMGVREAQNCLAAIKDYKIDLPVCFDFEYQSVQNIEKTGEKASKALCTSIARGFLETVAKAGYKVANYSNPSFLMNYFTEEFASQYPLWLAQWPKNIPNDFTKAPRKCAMWQYSNTGKVPGIAVNVDLDVCYEDAWFQQPDPPEEKEPVVDKPDTPSVTNPYDGKAVYDALMSYMMTLPVPEWANLEIEQAKLNDVTDGTRMTTFCTRAEAVAFAMRTFSLCCPADECPYLNRQCPITQCGCREPDEEE